MNSEQMSWRSFLVRYPHQTKPGEPRNQKLESMDGGDVQSQNQGATLEPT